MPVERAPDVLTPSLLDRLTDPASAGTGWRRGYSLDQIRQALRADLEDLLDTPRISPPVPPALADAADSIVNYGLPDLADFRLESYEHQREVARVLEETIRRFEPRLDRVQVEVLPPDEHHTHTLRLRIKAVLRADPAPDLDYNSILELATGRCQVSL